MSQRIGRRELIGAAAVVGAMGSGAFAQGEAAKRKIIGISCSPRKGKTTAAALDVCLKAAQKANPGVETELIELADLSIPVQLAAGQPLRKTGDLSPRIEPLGDPAAAGLRVPGSSITKEVVADLLVNRERIPQVDVNAIERL